MLGTSKVSIIIPIYHHPEYLQKLWQSLLNHTEFCSVEELIFINDSPDNHEIQQLLKSYQIDPPCPIQVGAPEANQGFPKSCNQAFEMKSSQTHALILNTDVVLEEGWLSKMLGCYQHAYKQGIKVSSVTPLTNNGTIATVPFRNRPYEKFEGLNSAKSMNRLAEHLYGAHDVVSIMPVGVGFCMLMSRECLEVIGGFDEIFSPGYGEEVDWCLRAFQHEFHALLDLSTFVYHKGGSSFSARQHALQQTHEALIRKRYPDYPERISHYIRYQSPFYMNQLFGMYWDIGKHLKMNSLTVHITHLNPFKAVGGVEKFIGEHISVREQRALILCREDRFEQESYVLLSETGKLLGEGAMTLLRTLLQTLSQVFELSWEKVLVHHLAHWKHDDALLLLEYFQKNTKEILYYVHDYNALSRHYNLLCSHQEKAGISSFCDVEICSACYDSFENQNHRNQYSEYLNYISQLCFPSKTASAVWNAHFSDEKVAALPQQIVPHYRLKEHQRVKTTALSMSKKPLHIAYLGYGRFAKGEALFLSLANQYKGKFKFSFIGHSEALERDPFIAYYPYNFREDEWKDKLKELPDVICLFSLWPETFGYTLYEAIEASVPVLTLRCSGHMLEVVKQYNIGCAFESEEEIHLWLKSDLSELKVQQRLWKDNVSCLEVVTAL